MMVNRLIMPIVFAVFTVLIFMIHFIGMHGITIHIIMIHSIILHGILLPGRMAVVGEVDGIRLITAGDGDIHHGIAVGTAPIMRDIMEVFMEDITEAPGMDMEMSGMLIQRITDMVSVVQPVQE